jgi:hypothetical protein
MFKKFGFVASLLIVLLSAGVASAQQGPEHSDPYWQVYYWDNMSLSGGAVVDSAHAHVATMSRWPTSPLSLTYRD